jgi:hypothetical protein
MTRHEKARSRTAAIDLHTHVSTTLFKAVAAAAVVSALLATPVFAQQAIQEPGAFAFYHPNLDVLNGGAPTPASRLANDPAAMQAYVAGELGNGRNHHRAYNAPETGTAPRVLLYGSTY